MNWSLLRLLYRHEMRLLLRARRTLVLSVLLPALIMPVMLLGSRYATQQHQKTLDNTVYKYTITGALAERIRGLIESARSNAGNSKGQFKFKEVEAKDPEKSLQNGDLHFYIDTHSGAEADALKDAPAQRLKGVPLIQVVFRGNQDTSSSGQNRIMGLLQTARRNDNEKALREHGFVGEPKQLFVVSSVNVASGSQVSGLTIGRFITMALVMLMLTGGSVAALDIIAGEKERGTLETLLTTAAGRREIIASKQLTISTVALIITLIQALNFFIYVKLKVVDFPALKSLTISSGTALTLLLLYLPMAVTLGAILLIVSAYAKSFKEANLYFFPVYLIGIVLSLAALLPALTLRSAIVLVPIANVSVAARELLSGRPDMLMIVATLAVMVMTASWLMRTASRMLSREEIVVASHVAPELHSGGAELFSKRVLRWFAVMWALTFAAAANFPQLASLRRQLFFNEVVIMLGASVLMLWRYRLNWKETLSLRPVKPAVWLAVLVAIPTASAAGAAIFRLANVFIPVSEEIMRSTSESMLPPDLPQWQVYVFLAILPAFCEEITFRGLLLGGLRKRLRPVPLALTVGLIFGFFHIALFRLAPTALLGVVLTGIAILTGSIFPGMLLHVGNNAWAVWSGEQGYDPSVLGTWQSAGLLAIFALAMWIIFRNRARPDTSAPPS